MSGDRYVGIVHQHVHSADVPLYPAERGLHILLLSDVSLHWVQLSATVLQLVYQLL